MSYIAGYYYMFEYTCYLVFFSRQSFQDYILLRTACTSIQRVLHDVRIIYKLQENSQTSHVRVCMRYTHPTDRYEQKQEEAQTTPPRLHCPLVVVRARAAVFACTSRSRSKSPKAKTGSASKFTDPAPKTLGVSLARASPPSVFFFRLSFLCAVRALRA